MEHASQHEHLPSTSRAFDLDAPQDSAEVCIVCACSCVCLASHDHMYVCVCVCVCVRLSVCLSVCVSLCMCVWCMFSIQRTILSAAVCVCAYWTIPRSASQRRRIPLLTLCVAVCYCVSASVGQSRVDRRLSMSCVE